MQVFAPLKELVGRERSVRGLCQSLHLAVSALAPPVTGAMHVTCADESEHECVTAFQLGFVQYVVPPLKSGHQAPFRLSNLGGRYEWGAAGVAEGHYATQASLAAWKLLVVKVNAHVGVIGTGPEQRFGAMARYGTDSPCCSALQMVLRDEVEPFVEPIEDALRSEGLDRIAALQDETRTPSGLRALYAALASARLQARQVMLDVQDRDPASPTLWVVLPCVTLNRAGTDAEILVGCYVADRRTAGGTEVYFGLGDDPGAYRYALEHGAVRIADDQTDRLREARDHRALVLQRFQTHIRTHRSKLADARLLRIRDDVALSKHQHHEHGRALLKAALLVMAEVAPVPAAALLFGYGAAGIHHAFTLHRLARRGDGQDEARRIVQEIHEHVDQLPPEQAQALLERLVGEEGA